MTAQHFQTVQAFDAPFFSHQLQRVARHAGTPSLFDFKQADSFVLTRKWSPQAWLDSLHVAAGDRAVRMLHLFPLISTVALLRSQPFDVPAHNIAGPLPIDSSVASAATCTPTVAAGDVLDAVHKLVQSGFRPLMLCPVHGQEPGGNYHTGHCSDEMDLIVRSAYGLALIPQWQQLVYGTSKTNTISYPICGSDVQTHLPNEFGGVFIPSVTVVRGPKQLGYPILDTAARFSASVFVTAPYTAGDKGQHAAQLVQMRRKLETFLTVAVAKGFDSVVLPLFSDGCMCRDMAQVTHAVAAVFCCRFQAISIVLDPSRPDILSAFQSEFKRFTPATVNMRELQFNGGSDAVCVLGGACADMHVEHRQSRVHAPLCPHITSCSRIKDAVHNTLWQHTQRCSKGVWCDLYDNKQHCSMFFHPDRCPMWSACTDLTPAHVSALWHPALCSEGMGCNNIGSVSTNQRLIMIDGC